MPGQKMDGSDLSQVAVANLTDHMLTFNKQTNDDLLRDTGQIKYENMEPRAFVMGSLKFLQKIITNAAGNPKTSKLLKDAINELLAEILEPPDYYSPELAQALLVKVLQALNTGLWGNSALKESTLISAIISNLSNISLIKKEVMIPETVVDFLKQFQDGGDGL